MELHSYAKRKASKKWNIEQKRKLVKARIKYDSWFNSTPHNSVVPWKKVVSVAKLDDFNVFFVRKQWSNMLTKYKLYKQTRLDDIGGINKSQDTNIIQCINQEWEFFEAIHTFMTRKTTNLHSYAVKQKSLCNTTNGSSSTEVCNGRNDNNNNSSSNKDTVESNNGNIFDEDNNAILEEQDCDSESLMSLSKRPAAYNEKKLQQITKEGSKEMEMATKTKTDLIKLQQDCYKENIPNNTTIIKETAAGNAPQVEDIQEEQQNPNHFHHMFSDDTTEEYEVICDAKAADTNDIGCYHSKNTDHDCYSKRMAVEVDVKSCIEFPISAEKQLLHFADTSEDSIEYVYHTTTSNDNLSMEDEDVDIELVTDDGKIFEIKKESELVPQTQIKRNLSKETPTSYQSENVQIINEGEMPTTSSLSSSSSSSRKTKKKTERDKYYYYKRHFNQRLEKRFDAVLHVMAQVVQSKYPSVDVSPLMTTIADTASEVRGLLSSEDSEEDNDNEKENN